MELNKLIIHEIIKGENQTVKVDINFSDDLATKDSQAIKFITELNNRYQNLRQSNGRFRPSAAGLFPIILRLMPAITGTRILLILAKKQFQVYKKKYRQAQLQRVVTLYLQTMSGRSISQGYF